MLLIIQYFLRGTGLYTNKQIGELFDLTYSAVSRRANIVKSEISKQSEMRQKYSLIKSMSKVWPYLQISQADDYNLHCNPQSYVLDKLQSQDIVSMQKYWLLSEIIMYCFNFINPEKDPLSDELMSGKYVAWGRWCKFV